MTDHPEFQIAPWELRWCGFDLDALPDIESIFALSNGHVGLRGNLDEGEPVGTPGTYLNGVYEHHELPYAEGGYGYPEDGQTIVNVTDGKTIQLFVQDAPMDMRYGRVIEHEHVLDFRTGTLRRNTVWSSQTGRCVRIRSERFVSFTQRAVAAIRYEVEPLDSSLDLVVQSDLLANEEVAAPGSDPRLAAALDHPLVADFAVAKGNSAVLVHQTRNSGLRVAAGMDHQIDDGPGTVCDIQAEHDLARLTIAADLAKGEVLRLTKFIAYGWSSRRSTPALRAQVDAALAQAKQSGWDSLLARQRDYLDAFWSHADIEIEGDPELQQAIRFALFQVLQAGARGESRPISAKGLTGTGYGGHAFWDTEIFVLPVLTHTMPEAAAAALRWRHSTLPRAKRRARELGHDGAMFAWRTINGDECSGYWPAGTAAVHVSADIAYATAQYVAATGDRQFEDDCGLELLVETARLWVRLGHHDSTGLFRIDGVTGPDEYTALVDNNLFTNLMAQTNLTEAADACERRPEVAQQLGVTAEEAERWRAAASHMVVPYNADLQVHEQSESFTRLAHWDFAAMTPADYPLLLNYPYFELYRTQVVKQSDLTLAMHLRGDAFTADEKARNFAYYEALTVRDSSLSACTQGVLAAEVGHLQLAYDYLAETAFIDLHNLHDNVSSGLHIAALAGTWTVCVAGFGGMRHRGSELAFAPALPDALSRLKFRILWRDSCLEVDVTADETTYRREVGDPIPITHHGRPVTLDADPVTLPNPKPAPVGKIEFPEHRAPYRRA
ncbi:glycoside hydrolase family 65 protein [Mycolicibacterium wolinskyi]|uniref:Glycosyl hydrolase n=1 Tax=Mycolicibacterium wolinskyi TaxID=59750 RepID=A0A1X2EZ74_9MYCO|nr:MULTISPECIES: glycosyl hydrolase family 65 protein [Mycolicibacterium]MCV7284930.1 glycoside hydrolase family 65 protein [Mycolicibacterium wolinskyi]MCV7292054.1 glycoside hydrolase family 65 protein [Mycolicibacterium goodii]ORX11445.1 glycosyl hydrolase [Mycolicibacterium wolinskyi]